MRKDETEQIRMQQQSGQGNGGTRRALSPGPGSDSDDSDISLGGTSPPSPSSTPPPTHHQPSPVSRGGPIGPIPPPTLNFHFDPTQSQFRFSHATAFKFPSTGFRFEPHSPQQNHPTIPNTGSMFRLTETSPFQAVGPRGDLGSRCVLQSLNQEVRYRYRNLDPLRVRVRHNVMFAFRLASKRKRMQSKQQHVGLIQMVIP
ncbi:hypothetical protein PV327_002786 [Microctonus hyperodae]|uniref:Uncharacterized protein n=1 Tax=Microctonus hyperodae TaxID=165561 RepID=A0AA39FG94_MICHY|nr:hypothetical protein PV327_002786 [Microctonus hyperodae]